MTKSFALPLLLLGVLCSAVLAPLAASAEDAPLTLTFGIYSSVKPSEMISKMSPVTKALQNSVGAKLNRPVTIRFQVAAKYQEGVTDLTTGKADFSRLGPASYVEASTANPQVALLAMESKNGSSTDFGIIAVKGDSPIKAVSELKGKSFAFGDELSTIGRYLSQEFLLQNNLKAADLSRYEYLGRHDAVGAAVAAGRFDAGALKEETFSKFKSSATPLRELARFPNTSQAWVGRAGLDPKVLGALRESLINLGDADALKALDADKLEAGNAQNYATVRHAMEINKEFFKQ